MTYYYERKRSAVYAVNCPVGSLYFLIRSAGAEKIGLAHTQKFYQWDKLYPFFFFGFLGSQSPQSKSDLNQFKEGGSNTLITDRLISNISLIISISNMFAAA